MTKKHSKAIAEIIKKYNKKENELLIALITTDLCNYFQKENPLFNRDKFVDACK